MTYGLHNLKYYEEHFLKFKNYGSERRRYGGAGTESLLVICLRLSAQWASILSYSIFGLDIFKI